MKNIGFFNPMTNIQRVISGGELRPCEHVPPPEKNELDIRHGIKEYFYYTPHNNKSLKMHFKL